MNTKVAVRRCTEYDPDIILEHIKDIYRNTGGPDVKGKKVLVKPNLLSDNDPSKCVSTHPAVLEAMIRFLRSEGATVYAGDSPAVHTHRFRGEKSGLPDAASRAGAVWVDFLCDPVEKSIRKRGVRIAAITGQVDLIISLPKLKTHELMYFTGAIKNTLGIIPGFSKAKQHALYRDREEFGKFLVDLNEVILPSYFLMDAIISMQGPGPGPRGFPASTGLLLGSTNPLALDIIASNVAGYEPEVIPTTKTALDRKKWLQSKADIVYDGPEPGTIVFRNFVKIPVSKDRNSGMQFVINRTGFSKKLQRRPVFNHSACTGCLKCVKICPVHAIAPHPEDNSIIKLNSDKCIRCFCCAEACTDNAIDVRVKFFGA